LTLDELVLFLAPNDCAEFRQNRTKIVTVREVTERQIDRQTPLADSDVHEAASSTTRWGTRQEARGRG